MLQSNTVSSPAIYTMLALCVLSMGFMIRFLIALATDGREIRVGHRVRLERVGCAADVGCEERQDGKAAVTPAAHLAMGVLRITTALASNSSRENKHTAADRPYIVTFAARTRKRDSEAERHYPLS